MVHSSPVWNLEKYTSYLVALISLEIVESQKIFCSKTGQDVNSYVTEVPIILKPGFYIIGFDWFLYHRDLRLERVNVK